MNTNNILLTMNKSSCTVIGWTECLHHTEEYLRKYLRRYLRKCLRTGRFVPGLVVQWVVLRALCWTRQVCLDLFGLDLSVWSFVPLQTLGRLFVRDVWTRQLGHSDHKDDRVEGVFIDKNDTRRSEALQTAGTEPLHGDLWPCDSSKD